MPRFPRAIRAAASSRCARTIRRRVSPAIERRIAAGDRRVIGFYDDVRVARLRADGVARFGDPALLFMNVNTPEERILAEAHGASTDGGRDRQEA